MKRFCPFTFVIALGLIALMVQPVAFAVSRVEHHQITSKKLADAGEFANRELSIYLPEGYETSELAYPVLYLISGTTGTNRSLLGASYGGRSVNVQEIIDDLINSGKVKPLMAVFPHMGRNRASVASFDDYFAQEIVSFVDETYRTIIGREARAVWGHSRGGHDALHIAFKYPQLFSLVGGDGSGAVGGGVLPTREVVAAHNQDQFPLQLRLSVGKNDRAARIQLNRDFVTVLQEFNLPYVYVEDNGTHMGMYEVRLIDHIVFFSERLGGDVAAVQPDRKLVTVWGAIKQF